MRSHQLHVPGRMSDDKFLIDHRGRQCIARKVLDIDTCRAQLLLMKSSLGRLTAAALPPLRV